MDSNQTKNIKKYKLGKPRIDSLPSNIKMNGILNKIINPKAMIISFCWCLFFIRNRILKDIDKSINNEFCFIIKQNSFSLY